MIIPEAYTEREGGSWINWPKDVDITQPIDFRLFSQRSKTSVLFKNLSVHSIAFGPVAAGWKTFLRWDCINGFNNF